VNKFCVNCGAPLTPSSKFCTNCGSPVVAATCPTCGQNWPGNQTQGNAPFAVSQTNVSAQSNHGHAATPPSRKVVNDFGVDTSTLAGFNRQDPVYGSKYNSAVDCRNCGAVFNLKTKICPLCSTKNK
jgi:predicted amidophosphoribosyltransferase